MNYQQAEKRTQDVKYKDFWTVILRPAGAKMHKSLKL
jgi:hypothetical protein